MDLWYKILTQICEFDPRAQAWFLKSVCGGNQARHRLLLVHLVLLLKHHLKITSSLHLDLTELGCENKNTKHMWPTAFKHLYNFQSILSACRQSVSGICSLEIKSISRVKWEIYLKECKILVAGEFTQSVWLDQRLIFIFEVLFWKTLEVAYMHVCPERVIYSRLSTGVWPRNSGGISDFAVNAGKWGLPCS